ncbi:MAG: AAA family ATPase, partial [Sphingobacteriia bacterium]|nr:AAA family ATPase [Sphingobacteriia bacterium]
MSEILERIRSSLVGLRMPRALEALDHTMRRLERGEITALEAIDGLLSEEHVTREGRRVTVAVKTARLVPIKTLE